MNKPEIIILHHSGGTAGDPTLDTSNQTLEIINLWHRTLWPNFPAELDEEGKGEIID